MAGYHWKHLSMANVASSLALAAAVTWAQSSNAETEDQTVQTIAPAAQNEILNDSRTTASAEAATAAKARGVSPPTLEVESPNVQNLANHAVAAASCELAEIEFEVGSSQVSASNLQQLSPVAECLKAQRSAVMWLIGEADTMGTDADNWVLAMNRAMAVKDALRSLGVTENQLVPLSAGPTGERSVSLDLAEAARVTRVTNR